jgi:hypothetical protein
MFGEKSKFEELGRRIAILLLRLDDLQIKIHLLECDITQCHMSSFQVEGSAKKIPFLLLQVNTLRKNRRDIKIAIKQCDKELIKNKRKHEPDTVNRSLLITEFAKTLSTHDLYCEANKLKDNKNKIEEKLNELKQGSEDEVSGVLALIEEWDEQINIYDEERKNRKPESEEE